MPGLQNGETVKLEVRQKVLIFLFWRCPVEVFEILPGENGFFLQRMFENLNFSEVYPATS